MAQLEIIGFPISTYVRAVRMACEEKRIPYVLNPVPPHQKPVSDIHPYGKVPCMRHGNLELFESHAIATYVDRKFNGRALFPDDAVKAAEAEKWISFVNLHVYPTMIGRYVLVYMFPPAGGEPDRRTIDAAVPEIRKQVKILDKAVEKTGYLAGRGLTFADLNVLPIINYLGKFPEGADVLSGAKNLTAWFGKLTARKSWKATEPPAA
jgi:glutathione S-transferase